MMKRFWFFVLLFCAPVVYAQQDYPRDITLSWTNADSYTDGTAIESGDLTGVRIECFRQKIERQRQSVRCLVIRVTVAQM